ncbi:MAG: hypothetical protein QOJ31_1554, partial [Gaiellales bacterium]|nr:hypothetical protein [Gaiellales bacterium]
MGAPPPKVYDISVTREMPSMPSAAFSAVR